MATFVLVPGAWIGGWCWQRVTPLLRGAGHEVYPLTLTGLADRSHLFTPGVGLETHIADVVNVLEYEGLDDVVLIGHSYAGMVAGSVADRVPDRVAKLVYLAAAIPEDGKSMVHGWFPEGIAEIEADARERCDGLRWPLPLDLGGLGVGLSREDEVWFRSRTSPQPLRPFMDAARLENVDLGIPRTFIHCTGEGSDPPSQVTGDDWQVYELHTGHWPMVTMPRELADLLLAIAENTHQGQ